MSIDYNKYQHEINRMVTKAISCSPKTWQKATLTISCYGGAINYKLKNDEDENQAKFSEALRKLCEELYVAMRNDGNAWTGGWSFSLKKLKDPGA